jgi:fatty-acid desaturase
MMCRVQRVCKLQRIEQSKEGTTHTTTMMIHRPDRPSGCSRMANHYKPRSTLLICTCTLDPKTLCIYLCMLYIKLHTVVVCLASSAKHTMTVCSLIHKVFIHQAYNSELRGQSI